MSCVKRISNWITEFCFAVICCHVHTDKNHYNVRKISPEFFPVDLFALSWVNITFPSRPLFVCKFSHPGDNLNKTWFPKHYGIGTSWFFLHAYDHTASSYRLIQLFRPNTRGYSQFLGVNNFSLPGLVSMRELRCIPIPYRFHLPPNLCLHNLP